MEKISIWNEEIKANLKDKRGGKALKTCGWIALGITSILYAVVDALRCGQSDGALTVMEAFEPEKEPNDTSEEEEKTE